MPLLNEWVDWFFNPFDWNPPFSIWWIVGGAIVAGIIGALEEL